MTPAAITATTMVMLASAGAYAAAQPEAKEAVRGLANSVEVAYPHRLKARSDQTPASPVLVRIEDMGGGKQRIEFIGAVAGPFDLRDFVEREDGRPLEGLPSMPIRVVSNLPPDHGTDLYGSESAAFDWRVHYREIAWTVAALWVLTPVAYVIIRRLRKPAAAPIAPPPPPPETLEEQLARAIEGSDSGAMSVEERGRLELLLIRYFGQRLGADLSNDPGAALAELRRNSESAPLVLAVERWLHARQSGEAARAEASGALRELRAARLSRPRDAAGVGA